MLFGQVNDRMMGHVASSPFTGCPDVETIARKNKPRRLKGGVVMELDRIGP
jgi:hypothetical protein